ncbi:MAG: transcription termination/antitermination factor NusG [Chloroflexota bacterium]|nr:transcription termination/antitermination factor NusG [Chloroflexota bacterium]
MTPDEIANNPLVANDAAPKEALEPGASVAAPEAEEPKPESAPEQAAAVKPEGPKRAWYVVHCYSGYENKVKTGLELKIAKMPDLRELVFRVVVPTEEEIDLRDGQRKVIQRRVFPGYVLVEMIAYTPESTLAKKAWYEIRNTPGVTGFVSSGDIPTPLREDEVTKILKRMETDQPKVRVTYRVGQVVHIIDGPFADFRGTVDDVNMEKGKVRVMVSFFGRETPVELDLLQVEKV